MANEAWSGIDVQLKRRSDLVPNLVESVKGYAAHERTVLEQVTELRNRARALPEGDVAARAQAEGALSAALVGCSRSPRAIPTSRRAVIFSNCSSS
jgi:LemA protein